MAIPGMDGLIEGAASQAGLPPDLVRIAICLFLSYPLCAVLKRLPDDSKALKEIYCTS
jgi:lysophospholipid acyltransferase